MRRASFLLTYVASSIAEQCSGRLLEGEKNANEGVEMRSLKVLEEKTDR